MDNRNMGNDIDREINRKDYSRYKPKQPEGSGGRDYSKYRPNSGGSSGGRDYRRYAPPDSNNRVRSADSSRTYTASSGANARGAVSPQRGTSYRSGSSKKKLSQRARKIRAYAIRTGLVLVFLVIVLIIGFVIYYNSVLNKITTTEIEVPTTDAVSAEVYDDAAEPLINILLVGIDTQSEDDVGRTDSMILASIDTVNRKIKLTSFMRDTWVTMPDYWDARLNAAHVYGGMPLLLTTLQYNFDVCIDKYVLVDFGTFADVINAVGGVDIPVTEAEAVWMTEAEPERPVQAGESVHLSGEQALLYSRIRKIDDDFHRTARQRLVLSTLVNRCRDANVFTLLSIFSNIADDLQTNMTKDEISKLLFATARTYRKYELVEMRIPVDDGYEDAVIDNQMVLLPDYELNKNALHDFLEN